MPTGWTTSGTGTNTYNSFGLTWSQVPSGGFSASYLPSPSTHSGTGMAGYDSWGVSPGGVGLLITPSLNFSSTGTYVLSFWVYLYNGGASDSLSVFVNTSAAMSGATKLIGMQPDNVSSAAAGWTQFTITIPYSFTGTSNYIIFRGTSAYGDDIFIDDVSVDNIPPTPCSGTPLAATITNSASAYTANAPLCAGTSITLNATDPNLPATANIGYQWQYSTSSTGPWSNVSSGTGATTVNYTFSPTASYYYRIQTICMNTGGGSNNSAAFYVPVGAPKPGTISGKTLVCPGDTTTFSVPNVSGTTYTWTLPSGWSGTSTSNAILVTPGSNFGTISVVANSSCGTSQPQTLNVFIGSAPANPASISGASSSCPSTAQTYSTPAVATATSYIWTIPSGWSPSGTVTTTTNSINVTTGTTGGSSTISVRAANGCGQSNGTATLSVAIITVLPNPGTIIGRDSTCSGVLDTFYINPVPGATSYQWILPTGSGWSGTTSGTSIQTFAGTASGTLSVTAYSSCASSPTSTKNIKVNATVVPTVAVTRANPVLCSGKNNTFNAVVTNGGTSPGFQWLKNGVNVGSNGPSYTDNTIVTGDRIAVRLTSSAVCASTPVLTSAIDTATVTTTVTPGININSTPPIIICAGTRVNFSTNRTGAGNAPRFQWYKNGNLLSVDTLDTYSSNTLQNGDSVMIVLTSSAACVTSQTATSNKVGVTVNPIIIPTISVAADDEAVVAGKSITFTATQSGGGTNPDYQWLKNGAAIPSATGDTYVAAAGDVMPNDQISVRMLSHDPCPSPELVTSNVIILKADPLSVASLGNWEGPVSLYPNPTTGHFTISASWSAAHVGKRVSIDILNALGQSVYRSELAPNGKSWHTDVTLSDGLAAGRYMLRISGDGMRTTVPFVLGR